jgi:ribosomal-protein-alanine N-acetyltransferase
MAGPPTPRPLRADDVAAVADIERRVFSDPWSARSFAEMLALDPVRGFAVDDEHGRLIGYAVCSTVADEGEILNLAVEPHARGRGLGAALVGAMLDWLKTRGAERVFLEVRRSNEAAIAVYQRAGFTPLGTRRAYYRDPREDALTMALDLVPGGAGK